MIGEADVAGPTTPGSLKRPRARHYFSGRFETAFVEFTQIHTLDVVIILFSTHWFGLTHIRKHFPVT